MSDVDDFLIAAQNGDTIKLLEFFRQNNDIVNYPNKNGDFFEHILVKNVQISDKDTRKIFEILSKEIPINSIRNNKNKHPALFLATQYHKRETAIFLNRRSVDGFLPMHFEFFRQNFKIALWYIHFFEKDLTILDFFICEDILKCIPEEVKKSYSNTLKVDYENSLSKIEKKINNLLKGNNLPVFLKGGNYPIRSGKFGSDNEETTTNAEASSFRDTILPRSVSQPPKKQSSDESTSPSTISINETINKSSNKFSGDVIEKSIYISFDNEDHYEGLITEYSNEEDENENDENDENEEEDENDVDDDNDNENENENENDNENDIDDNENENEEDDNDVNVDDDDDVDVDDNENDVDVDVDDNENENGENDENEEEDENGVDENEEDVDGNENIENYKNIDISGDEEEDEEEEEDCNESVRYIGEETDQCESAIFNRELLDAGLESFQISDISKIGNFKDLQTKFVDYNPNIKDKGRNMIHFMVEHEMENVIYNVLNDINCIDYINAEDGDNKTPLCYAFEIENARIAMDLIQNDSTLAYDEGKNVFDINPKWNRVIASHVFNYLLSLMSDSSVKISRFREVLKSIGPDNFFDRNGLTFLHYLSSSSKIENIADILEQVSAAGANFNVGTKRKNKTPLQVACENNNLEMVRCLVKYAKCDVADIYGQTPLHAACINGNKDIVLILLRNNASESLNNNKMYPRFYLDESLLNDDEIQMEINEYMHMIELFKNFFSVIDSLGIFKSLEEKKKEMFLDLFMNFNSTLTDEQISILQSWGIDIKIDEKKL